jgi:hypothetical protein
MRHLRLHKIVSVIAVCLCLSGQAQEKDGWQFDSLGAKTTPDKPDAQIIYELLLKMLDAWNSHDLDRYFACFWNSSDLLIIVDSEQFNGWQQMHDLYIKSYPDRALMGFANPARIQVKLLKPDIALALTWWSLEFRNSKQKVVGSTTMTLQKFDDGWKIVSAHSSTAEM